MIPSVVDTFLTRLTDPSPTHHALRAPFIRPLLNTIASNQPLFNILSPVYEPKAEHMEPESPIQARLIEFFEEKKGTLLMNTVIEEDLPVFVYCIHRKRMLGAPQLVINETYNSTLNKASKVTAIPHLLSVISHQFSLMLQAQADPNFKVTTSRRPSDLDRSSEFLAMKRASFADFQIESEPEGRSAQKVRYTPQEYAPQGIRKRLTGSNNAPLGSNTRWGSSPTTPSKSGEFQTRSSSPTDSNRASSSLKAKSPSKRFTRESAPHPGR
ncbi:hypothetical protein FRC16_001397 [Serendipita sp. 398]|nr:hypothetical protein FRC16_001397 [Serendipita sp. 398]